MASPSGSSSSRSSSISITSSSVTATSTSSTSTVLIDTQGSGGTADLHFRVSGPWHLKASWNCASSSPGFQLELKTREGNLVTQISGTGKSQAEKEFAAAGSYRIQVTAGCPWHVLVQG
jgi:hypothetical protein